MANRVIARSRTTLATIEAAAIERQSASPPTTQRTGQGSGGFRLPSTSAMSGIEGKPGDGAMHGQ